MSVVVDLPCCAAQSWASFVFCVLRMSRARAYQQESILYVAKPITASSLLTVPPPHIVDSQAPAALPSEVFDVDAFSAPVTRSIGHGSGPSNQLEQEEEGDWLMRGSGGGAAPPGL